jgi:hypothetical protein
LETEQKAGVRNGKPGLLLTNHCCRRGCASRRNPPAPRATICQSDKSAGQTIGAREDGERITRIRNRRCYGGANRRHLDHVGARRRRQKTGQGKERKRRPDARHNGSSYRENRVKRRHGFHPSTKVKLRMRYARAPIAAVTALTTRAPGELNCPRRRILLARRQSGSL